jgi:AraC-like DNA-binding protein
MVSQPDVTSATVREIQVFIGAATEQQPYENVAQLHRFVERLPPTSTRDTALLRGLLLDFSFEWAERCHDTHHRRLNLGPADRCDLRVVELTAHIWKLHRREPLAAIRVWAREIVHAFEREHPEMLALRLRDAIENGYEQPLQALVESIADSRHAAGRLRRLFTSVIGCSAHDYLTRRRVTAAQELLRDGDDKMEVIARAVGWKSPKDLYRAVQDVTGRTPAELRAALGEPARGPSRCGAR